MRVARIVLVVALVPVVLTVLFLALNRHDSDVAPVCGWNMIDSLEKGKLLLAGSESIIREFADVSTNNDSYISANRLGMKKKVTIASEQRSVVFAPSPLTMQFEVQVPAAGVLDFGYGISPEAWSKLGDGTLFEVTALDGKVRRVLFSDYINPKARKEDRKWFDARIDLSEFAGKSVRLEFSTRGTYRVEPPFKRAPDNRFDYAFWSNPHVFSENEWAGRPNVILISIDTLRADHVSCLGHERKTTPNLDELAGDSLLFERCVTPAPWTLPAHASLLTGLLPSRHGVQNYYQSLSDEALTIAEVLRSSSFLTLGVGSFDYLFPDYGLVQGYDEYFFRYPLRADTIVRKGLDWLDLHHGRQFFLFLHIFDCHDPYNAPSPYDKMFCERAGDIKKEHKSPITAFVGRGRRPSDRDIELITSLYDGEIRFVDEQLRFLFKRLKELGIWDKTMIVVTSDHGEEFYEHRSFGHGLKLFDEQIMVPLIIKLPHSRIKGRRIKQQVGLIDVLPSVLDGLGIKTPDDIDGRSLLSGLDSRLKSGIKGEEYYISETVAQGIRRNCLRFHSHKYISANRYNYKGLVFRNLESLFDLVHDDGENENLALREPELARSLRLESSEQLYELDRPGWRLVFSTPSKRTKFTGRIETDGAIKNIYSLPCGGEALNASYNTIEFVKDVTTYESTLYFEIEPADAEVRMEIVIDGSSECLAQIMLGSGGAHPTDNPFSISRSQALADMNDLIGLLNERGKQEGILVMATSGKEKAPLRLVKPATINARRREGLKALGYMR
ncbi:sulfatase [bacterium]|nr:sulfatase [bacterium]